MRFVDEFRDAAAVRQVAARIAGCVTRRWTIMEVCGGQTHAIVKHGLDQLLPSALALVHGPGCPVCVTPLELIDQAIAIAARPEVVFTSFGDMLRVPGSTTDLLGVKARGGDVRIVYSPLDALELARRLPERQVVFFAVGFETTAPGNAMAVWRAHELGLGNFSILCAHVLVPPAMEAILSSPECRVQGFLAAGHVCTVEGIEPCERIAARFGIPIVITGFEPLDLLAGIQRVVAALEAGRHGVENAYARAVRPQGNPRAREMVGRVFAVCDRPWRGIGTIPQSGLALREELAGFDAARRFGTSDVRTQESAECIAGQVLMGTRKPAECPAFAARCTPDAPLGAPMVSPEGACAAYFHYRGRP